MAAVSLGKRRMGRGHIALGGAAIFVIVFAAIMSSMPPIRRLLANPAGATPQVGITHVAVRGDAEQNHVFAPAVIQIPVGSTVTWSFDDRGRSGDGELVPHNVVGAGWASDILSDGTFAHTFDQPGSYPYRCTLHAYMDGRVEVAAK